MEKYMNGINNNPALFGNDSFGDDNDDWEVLDEHGEWVDVLIENLDMNEREELRKGFSFKSKTARKKTTGGGGHTGGGVIGQVLSAAAKEVLRGLIEPVATGLIIDAITGDEKLDHPAGSKPNDDGTTTYPDGSIAQKDNTIVHPDKAVSAPSGLKTYPDGRVLNKITGVMKYPNGIEVQGVKSGGYWTFPNV